jgi:hypothetical protein
MAQDNWCILSVLQKVEWITPAQDLGFGAGRVATRLKDKGLLFGPSGTPLSAKGLTLGVCHGPPSNRNQTGLAIRVTLPARAIKGVTRAPTSALLTGDADSGRKPRSGQAQSRDSPCRTEL